MEPVKRITQITDRGNSKDRWQELKLYRQTLIKKYKLLQNTKNNQNTEESNLIGWA